MQIIGIICQNFPLLRPYTSLVMQTAGVVVPVWALPHLSCSEGCPISFLKDGMASQADGKDALFKYARV